MSVDVNIHNVVGIRMTRKSGSKDDSVKWYALEIDHVSIDGVETADFTLFMDSEFVRVEFGDDRPAKLEAV